MVVRVPDWWSARRPPRPQVQVTVGSRPPGGFGTDALLDFDVRVTLDGEALTPAEIAVLRLIAAGNANKQIADQLSVTEETVKGRVKNILSKLGANDRTHAAMIGLKRGIIEF